MLPANNINKYGQSVIGLLPCTAECQQISYLSTLCCKLNLHCSSVNFVVANSMKHSVIYIFFNFVYLVHFDRLDMNSSVLHTFYLNEVLSQKLKVVGSVLLQMEKNSTTTGKNKIKGVCIFSYSM